MGKKNGAVTAEGYLQAAAAEMRDRAASRDQPTGERSMGRAVEAFWVIYGPGILARGYMTETEGWEFMSILKKVRGSQGQWREDDYTDDVAYAALAAESSRKDTVERPPDAIHDCGDDECPLRGMIYAQWHEYR